ncbi:MAG: hypothetical protein U0894_01580 [Pirellulales bacterium]
MHWMVAKEYCEHKLMGIFLKIMKRFRSIAEELIRQLLNLPYANFKPGGVIGMFPEGRINLTESHAAGSPWHAMIAMKAGVPLIPIYVRARPTAKPPSAPFSCERASSSTSASRLMSPLLYRGKRHSDRSSTFAAVREIAKLAGVSNFEPLLAGRNWKPTAEQIAEDLRNRELAEKEKAQQRRTQTDRGEETL